MTKLEEILRSYAIMLDPTDDQKFIAKERLQVCMGCPHWVNSKLSNYCDVCTCITSAKVFSPIGQDGCPKKKWLR